jgi:hypothetical protein
MSSRIAVALLTVTCWIAPFASAQDSGSTSQILLLGGGSPALPGDPPAPSERLEAFDEQALDLRWGQGGWQLWAGPVILKDFGRNEQDGRTVVNLIRELHLDTRGRLGAPHAVAEYWLSGGKPPQAAPNGARTLAFDAASLSVQQVNSQWMLRDRSRALLAFGNNEAEARRALAVFQHYHFDHVGYVGDPIPTFMYFLSSSNAMERAEATAARSTRAGMQMKDGSGQDASAANSHHDSKRKEIDPRKGTQLLPPGRQLIQVSSLPGQTNLPDRLPFNWQKAKIHQLGENWEMVSQDLTIARFGADGNEARHALALLRHYHFTELCMIGGDEPCFQFLLANGRMPREVRFGLSNIAFHPERVQVNSRAGQFIVEADGTFLCNCGPREDAARALCTFIQQNNPDHLCWIGTDPQHGMTFFVRESLAPFNSRNDVAPAKPR